MIKTSIKLGDTVWIKDDYGRPMSGVLLAIETVRGEKRYQVRVGNTIFSTREVRA